MTRSNKAMVQSQQVSVKAPLRRFVSDERGATSIEYALIASGISIGIVGVVASLGSNVKGFFTSVSTALK